jgi:hypothetical protein
MSIEDVTSRVNAAVKPEMNAEEAFLARRAVMAEIEKESLEKTGLRSDVVTLYQGGKYHLYRFKKYTDVRLVFAPEQQIAFFGGDPDNFEYPRYDLDICLFQPTNGQPAKVEHYLTWSTTGVSDGELVFVSGHPGNTSRQLTMTELNYLRDRQFPYTLQRLYDLEVTLTAYSVRSEENARRAKDLLFGVQNSRKAREGMFAGLLDPAIMKKKQTEERLRAAAAQSPGQGGPPSLGLHRRAQKIIAQNRPAVPPARNRPRFIEHASDIARTIMRAVEEKSKPSGERLREFRDSNLESPELQLSRPSRYGFRTPSLTDLPTRLVEQLVFLTRKGAEVLASMPRDRAPN